MTSFGLTTLRDSLRRLALAGDDRGSALTLLFLLRAAASEGRIVEISPSEDETLVTVDEEETATWLAELMPIRMTTLESVLVCAPELSVSFVRIGHGEDLVLQARRPHAAARYAVRETPIEMPGMDLLVAAGLIDPS